MASNVEGIMLKDGNQVYEYDQSSRAWIQPSSLLLDIMFPVETIFGDWYKYQTKRTLNSPECAFDLKETDIEIGSQAEGFCIPELFLSEKKVDKVFHPLHTSANWSPDHDVMHTKSCYFETQLKEQKLMFNVEHIAEDPRYVKLQLTGEWREDRPQFKTTRYLSQVYLLPLQNQGSYNQSRNSFSQSIPGPASKELEVGLHGIMRIEKDYTNVFNYPIAWPEVAMEWLIRTRRGNWPSPDLIQDILDSGCHIAPVGRCRRNTAPVHLLEYMKNPNQHTSEQDTEWRISFSIAENKLAESVSPVQRHVFVLMKIIKKAYFPEVVSTYHLKNILFWQCENAPMSLWKEDQTLKCLIHMFDLLVLHMKTRNLPHYIIPESNLFQNADTHSLDEAVTTVEEIRCNILEKLLSVLKRLASITYCTHEFISSFDFDPFLKLIQDETLKYQKVNMLFGSIYDSCIHKCSEMIQNKNRALKDFVKSHQQQESIQLSKEVKEMECRLMLPVKVYQSVLARLLCWSWNHKHDAIMDERMFQDAIKKEVKDLQLECCDDIVKLCNLYYCALCHNGNLLHAVPLATQSLKDVYVNITSYQKGGIHDAKKVLDQFHVEDVKNIEAAIVKELQEAGGLANASIKDIEIMLEVELNKLALKKFKEQ